MGAAALAGPAGSATGLVPVTETFGFTGGPQSFVVPAGVTSVTIDAFGGQGGSSASATTGTPGPSSPGGLGGEAQATVTVTPGETLQVNVGGQGADATVTSSQTAASGTPQSSAFNGGACGGIGTGGGASTDAAANSSAACGPSAPSTLTAPGITAVSQVVVGAARPTCARAAPR